MKHATRRLAPFTALALACTLILPATAADSPGAFDLAAAGDRHALAVKADATLWSWGSNAMGQLGDGTVTDRGSPAKIMDAVTAVSAGTNHSLAVQSDGSLWAWGNNASGQLGLGSRDNDAHPTPAKVMDNVAGASAGASHSLALKTDGSLWAWGANRSGQLGNGTVQDQHSPVKIMDDVAAVSAGEAHTLALKTDGSLWAWGANLSGQLGAPTQNRSDGDPMGDCLLPMQVMEDVTALSAGCSYSMVVQTDGSLWVWGDNQYGQLGNGGTGNMAIMQPGSSSSFCQTTPVQILLRGKVTAVSAGGSSRGCHSLAVLSDGSLWGWGDNRSGQLSPSAPQSALTPLRLDSGVQQAAAGGAFSLAVKGSTLLAWGNNSSGQLGLGTSQGGGAPAVPTPAPTPTTPTVTDPTVTTPPTATPTPQPVDPYDRPVMAYARTQDILIDGQAVTFQAYALKDTKGYETNYVKLRDAAFALNGSRSQFQMNWTSASGTSILTNQPYISNGSEMHTPYSGDRQGKAGEPTLWINGREVALSAILLTDDKGGGYTYFKLRDLGRTLGFNVTWDKAAAQVRIETGKPYTG